MEAEYVGKKEGFVKFQKADGSRYVYPYEKLSESDRARIDALVFASPPDADAAASASTPGAPAVPPGEIAAGLAGKLVAVKGSALVPVSRDQLNRARYIAFYHSAHWCPPCKAFTPELVAAYKEIKAKHPEFELFFVSHDHDEDSMKGYMVEFGMAWPALRFDQTLTARVARRPKNENGIPNLVFMDAHGKEISTSFTPDGEFRGPRAVLADIQRQFASAP
jgi:nucleoredoxin